MKKIAGKIRILFLKGWPVLTLLLIVSALFAANYKPGTFLTGWDNLHPEFAPGVNIQRSIFAVWQEYQSLGLLGGMGHASDLVRQIYILVLTYILPLNLVRYASTFTMLFLGAVGCYFLTKYLLESRKNDEHIEHGNNPFSKEKILAFTSSLFYLLNIATIQSFYAPFEAFNAHFAALPWLFLASCVFLEKQTRKTLLFASVVLLLSTPAAYIPTLFVVYILAISIYILVNLTLSRERIKYLLSALKLFLVIFVVNAFWLLPFLFFTVTKSQVNVNSKINQMATRTIYEQNKEFGNITDTALLRGFWFNNVDPDLEGRNTYMLEPWRQHFNKNAVRVAGFAIFAVILAGSVAVLRNILKKNERLTHSARISFAVLFLFSFTMLATSDFPFSFFNEIFRKFPLFEQAFRFPFTKFNTLAALTYSVMLAFGMMLVVSLLSKLISRIHKKRVHLINNIVLISCFMLLASAIFWIAAPAFGGSFFYSKNTIKIPDEYFEMFDYFKNQDTNARIANLPQPTFWGWTFYRWGYGGSGFIWYGIKQPILDRAFDVWSEESENYYYELSFALYRKDEEALMRVLNKYQISYILLDKNVIYPSAPGALFYDETERMLANMPQVSLDASFGNIKIFKIKLADAPKSFVFTDATLPVFSVPFYKSEDSIYEKYGNYASGNNEKLNDIFPFSLFSLKYTKDKSVKIVREDSEIVITKEIELFADATLKIPPYDEKIIPATFYKSKDDKGVTEIFVTIKRPAVLIDGKVVSFAQKVLPLFSIPSETPLPLRVNINGTTDLNINLDSEDLLGITFLSRSIENQIVISGEGILDQAKIANEDYAEIFEDDEPARIAAGKHTLSVVVAKIDDSYSSLKARGVDAKFEDCNAFRTGQAQNLFAEGVADISNYNGSTCLTFFSETLPHDSAYAVFLGAQNLKGRPLRFWILNEDGKTSPLDTYLDPKITAHAYILPHMEDNGNSYSFHFDNSAIGQDTTQNILSYLEVYPIPARFIEDISLSVKIAALQNESSNIIEVSHPNESYYKIKLPDTEERTLILSQSYDPGWKAYYVADNPIATALPFIFGKEIKPHLKINSWENGWEINERGTKPNQTIVIRYLPQYLEGAGLVFLFILITTVLIGPRLTKKKIAG